MMASCGVTRHLPEALAEPQKPRSDVKMRWGNDSFVSSPIVANGASEAGRSHLPLEMADNSRDNPAAGFHGVDAVAQLKSMCCISHRGPRCSARRLRWQRSSQPLRATRVNAVVVFVSLKDFGGLCLGRRRQAGAWMQDVDGVDHVEAFPQPARARRLPVELQSRCLVLLSENPDWVVEHQTSSRNVG